jgi:hypothetical protein
MPLPSLSAPEFRLVLPSNKQDITYRPFTVKEQKSLLIAKDSDDKVEIINATQKTVAECCNIPIEKVKAMPYFDIEWIFLHIRSKSVGETFEFVMSHGEAHECKATTDVKFNLEDVKFVLPDDATTSVMVNDDIGIEFRYPTFEELSKFSDITSPLVMYDFIVNNIKSVFDKEKVYDDFTKQEAETFVDSLKTEQYSKVLKWFNNIPILKHEIKWTCKSCNQESTMTLIGINDFFL